MRRRVYGWICREIEARGNLPLSGRHDAGRNRGCVLEVCFPNHEFARLTRLAEDSIRDWENGTVIQNAAYDRFLYLLTFPENVARLRFHSITEEDQPEESSSYPSLPAKDWR